MQFIYVLHVLDRFASAFAQSIMPHAYPSTHIYTYRTFQSLHWILFSVLSSTTAIHRPALEGKKASIGSQPAWLSPLEQRSRECFS